MADAAYSFSSKRIAPIRAFMSSNNFRLSYWMNDRFKSYRRARRLYQPFRPSHPVFWQLPLRSLHLPLQSNDAGSTIRGLHSRYSNHLKNEINNYYIISKVILFMWKSTNSLHSTFIPKSWGNLIHTFGWMLAVLRFSRLKH